MSRIPELKKERNDAVIAYYKLQADKKIYGKQMYRHEAILAMASKKFFLAESTIQQILGGHDVNDKMPVDPNQLNLLDEIKKNESPAA